MKMHFLSGGRLRMRRSIYVPGAAREETIDLPVSCALLRHPQGNVLFDTGCHPQVIDDAQGRWGSMAKAMTPIFQRDEGLLVQLSKLGLGPDDVDVVVNSHLHSDHCGCNEFFKRATFYCHAKELVAAQGPDAQGMGYLPVDWQHPMPVRTVDGEYDLLGDGRMTLVPLPGHTPGSMGLIAVLERSGTFLLAADAAALGENLERETVPRNTWDAELALGSLQEIRRFQRTGARVIFGHDAQQWTTLKKGLEAYD